MSPPPASPRPALLAVLLLPVAAALIAGCGGTERPAAAGVQPQRAAEPAEAAEAMLAEPIRWRRSVARGLPHAGRLVDGVLLPSEGEDFFTWDPVHNTVPNREWRRYATDRLLRTLLKVLREFRAANPGAPRLGIGDLSRPRGGNFGERFGGRGHASHQNGLDADVYYPRLDLRERGPASVAQVDRALSQDLVDRFVRAGARYVFVGPRVGLRGKRRIVQPLAYHDNHMHVRIR